MLTLYRILARLLAPLLLKRLQRDASPQMQARAPERLGQVKAPRTGSIWIHAASVGEVNAVQGLVEALLQNPARTSLLLSTFTLTGAERARALFGDRVDHCLAPIDTRAAVSRWLDAHRPALALIAETEIWPELYHQAGQRQLGLILINARLSERGLARSRRFGRLFARALQSVSLALCQSEQDGQRFRQLGLPAEKIEISGNLKFDITLPPDIGPQARLLREQWGARPCWVAGSTREGEELQLLEAQRQLKREFPNALLILAPRHPDRAEEVAGLIRDARLEWQAYGETVRETTDVVLVDRIGVLLPCYAAAAVAFVGGSLVPIGGHNLLEPAALGKAILAGPHLDNQTEAAQALRAAGALLNVAEATALAETVARLWRQPELALEHGGQALAVVEQGRGSLRRSLKQLEPYLTAAAG
jgi:3-deoxy-D-manno-octulosonic-acid transferase